jgi:DNA-binding CsgD family transcriptional regulator
MGEREQAKGQAVAFSPREREVVDAVLAEETNHAIAERCGISPHTVNSYLRRVADKIGDVWPEGPKHPRRRIRLWDARERRAPA